MLGGNNMETKYNTIIPDDCVNEYIDKIISQTFALLPLFEEKLKNDSFIETFKEKQESLISKLHGFLSYMVIDNMYVMDILTHAENLKACNDHSQYRKHILRMCSLLSSLKVGD